MIFFQNFLGFIFFILFFDLTLILLVEHKFILKNVNEILKDKGGEEITDIKLFLISGLSAYLTIYFFLYPNQNLLNVNMLFIDYLMGN